MRLKPATEQILHELGRFNAERLLRIELEDQRRQKRGDRQLPASLARAITQMATPAGGLAGAERELGEETARAAHVAPDLHRLRLPLTALTSRALIAATDAAGGYLVGTDAEDAVDALRPWSIAVAGGVTVLPGLAADARVPWTATDPTVAWMSAETASATPSDPVLGAAALTPHAAVGVSRFTRQSLLQSAASIETWVRSVLARTVGVIVDTAVLQGSGSSGQPEGVLSKSLASLPGTSLALSSLLTMKKSGLDAGAQESAIKFLGDTATGTLLEGRPVESGGGRTIWQDGKIANCAAFATPTMPDDTLLCGPLDRILLGFFGPAVELAVDPYTDFKANIIAVRVTVFCDVGLAVAPTAFTKSTSVT